ncbi:hypothetical protein ACFX13_046987 [Malus domestica]
MAEESRNTGSEPIVTNPSSSPNFLPLTETQAVAELVPVYLTRTNYFLWRSSFIPILMYYDMFNMVEGLEQPPPQFLMDRRGKISTVENPAYTSWIKKDRTCMTLISANLVDSTLLCYTVGCASARDVWLNLEKRLAPVAKAHVLHLKARIQTLTKGRMSMEEYLEEAEDIADDLAAAGSPLDDCDFVDHVLDGLPSNYDDLATIIWARGDGVTREELHALLQLQGSRRWDWTILPSLSPWDYGSSILSFHKPFKIPHWKLLPSTSQKTHAKTPKKLRSFSVFPTNLSNPPMEKPTFNKSVPQNPKIPTTSTAPTPQKPQKTKLPTAQELISHYESQGLDSQEASLKVIGDLQTALYRVISSGRGRKDRILAETSRKIDSTNNSLAILNMKVDSKPGFGEAFGIGVASGVTLKGIETVLPHVIRGFGEIWNTVRSATKDNA